TDDAVAFASGMAAVTSAIWALCRGGDHVVLFSDCYRRTRQFVSVTLAKFGVTHTQIPAGDIEAMRAALRPETRLVITESPTNPYLYCVDLEKIAEVLEGYSRAKVLIDSTF